MNKRNKLSTIICTLLAVMMIAVFIPAVPVEAYAAEQIKVTAVDVQSFGADLYNYKSDLGFALDYLIDMENDPPVSEMRNLTGLSCARDQYRRQGRRSDFHYRSISESGSIGTSDPSCSYEECPGRDLPQT